MGQVQMGCSWLLIILVVLFLGSQANTDADALLAIKAQLGATNRNLSSWVGNEPCTPPWDGVICTGKRVTKLNLTEKGLVGPFPSEFGNLTSLEVLDLENNNITGPVPATLSKLSNLNTLNLSANLLLGEFPQPILGLQKLVDLSIGRNNLSGAFPDFRRRLPLLQAIYLSYNFTGGFPVLLSNLPSTLTKLSISRSTINSPLPGNLGLLNLKKLQLDECGLQGPLPVEWGSILRNLEFLELHSNNLTGTIPDSWSQMTNLRTLGLHSNNLTGTIPDSWSQMTNLRTLELYSNNLTGTIPDSWSQMTNLRTLDLNNNMLRGYIPSWIRPSFDVILACNYFSGAKPANYSRDRIKGNCFEGDLRDHNRECHDTIGCARFLAMFPLPPPPPPPPPSPPMTLSTKKNSRSKAGIIGGGVLGGVLLSFLAMLLLWKCMHRYYGMSLFSFLSSTRVTSYYDAGDSGFDLLKDWEVPSGVEAFQLDEINRATHGFSKECEIGSGGFGKVYRGELNDGRVVAIKKAHNHNTQDQEFLNEIMLLSRLHHRHLVRLIGFCGQAKCQILVYEYMQSGNLHDLLEGRRSDQVLDWYKRLEIAVAVAQGIEYLHNFADPPVIHRDLKPSNILLDGNMVAKISDFGISKVWQEFDTHVSTGPAGTVGYLDPEYFLRRQLTSASDVYGFGVILLELITGQKAIDHKRPEEFNLIEWVKPRLTSGGVGAIIDSRLTCDKFVEDVYQVLAVTALECAAFTRSLRPSMKEVLSTLTSLLKASTKAPSQMHRSSSRLFSSRSFGDDATTTTTMTTEEFPGEFTEKMPVFNISRC